MPTRKAMIVLVLTLALGLAAVATAQAYEWSIEGEELSGLGGKEAVTASGGTFKLSTPGLGLTVACTSMSGTGEIVEEGGGSGIVTFGSCKVEGASNCTVNSPGKSAGTLEASVTTKFIGKEVSKAVKYYEELSIKKMIVEFTGKLCVLPKENVVTGTTAAEVSSPGEAKKRVWKFSESIAKEAGTALFFGKETAFLTGEATEELSGANKGLALGAKAVMVRPLGVIHFIGTGASSRRNVTVKNIGDLKVKLTNLSIVTGGFNIIEPMPACKNMQLIKFASCVPQIECTIVPIDQHFSVEWDELNAAGTVVRSDSLLHPLKCENP